MKIFTITRVENKIKNKEKRLKKTPNHRTQVPDIKRQISEPLINTNDSYPNSLIKFENKR